MSGSMKTLKCIQRMEALGNLIQQHLPDLICFQEVTPSIFIIFQNSNWWKDYERSVLQEMMSEVPVKSFGHELFENSIMGSALCLADVDVGAGKKLVIAASYLEGPCPATPKWDQMYSEECVARAKESISHFQDSPNIIFGGDMNWDDKGMDCSLYGTGGLMLGWS